MNIFSQTSVTSHLQAKYQSITPRVIAQTDLVQAAVLIAITESAEPKVVLTRRAKHMKTHQGDVALPGGKVDIDDSSIEQTALREAYEEVGILPESVQIIGALNQVVSKLGILVTPILGVIAENTPLSINEDELDAVFTTPLRLFTQPPVGFFTHAKMKIPSYDFEQYHIWGLTAVIMAEFMNQFYHTKIEIQF